MDSEPHTHRIYTYWSDSFGYYKVTYGDQDRYLYGKPKHFNMTLFGRVKPSNEDLKKFVKIVITDHDTASVEAGKEEQVKLSLQQELEEIVASGGWPSEKFNAQTS